MLVKNYKAYNDEDGKYIAGNPPPPNPETFACVAKNSRDVVLGTVDGRRTYAQGMTFHELQNYLLRLHCYSALVFDGGGSTTMTGRSSTRSAVRVLNVPSEGVERALPAGLLVMRKS